MLPFPCCALKYRNSVSQAATLVDFPVNARRDWDSIESTTIGFVFASVHQFPEVPFQRAAEGSHFHTTRPGKIPLAIPIGVLAESVGTNTGLLEMVAGFAKDSVLVFRNINNPAVVPETIKTDARTYLEFLK